MRLRGLVSTDRQQLADVLAAIDVLRPEEVDVALELVDDNLAEGERSEYQFLVASTGREVLGYVCFGPIPLTESSFDLYWILVAPQHQRRGLGRRLLRGAEREARRQGGRRMYIETSSTDAYASTRAFYESLGYSEAARFPDFYRDGDAKVVYWREL